MVGGKIYFESIGEKINISDVKKKKVKFFQNVIVLKYVERTIDNY